MKSFGSSAKDSLIHHTSFRLLLYVFWMDSVTKGICRQSFYAVEKCHLSLNKLSLDTAQCPNHQCAEMKRAPHLIFEELLTQKYHMRWLSTTSVVKIIIRHATHRTLNSSVMNSFSRQLHFWHSFKAHIQSQKA